MTNKPLAMVMASARKETVNSAQQSIRTVGK